MTYDDWKLASPPEYSEMDHIDELPDDYEECAVCGFDHEYSPTEAQLAHSELNSRVDDECLRMIALDDQLERR